MRRSTGRRLLSSKRHGSPEDGFLRDGPIARELLIPRSKVRVLHGPLREVPANQMLTVFADSPRGYVRKGEGPTDGATRRLEAPSSYLFKSRACAKAIRVRGGNPDRVSA